MQTMARRPAQAAIAARSQSVRDAAKRRTRSSGMSLSPRRGREQHPGSDPDETGAIAGRPESGITQASILVYPALHLAVGFGGVAAEEGLIAMTRVAG